MEPDRWDRIKAVFSDAAELPKPEQAAFLDRACAGDPDMRVAVENLLGEVDETRTGIFNAAPVYTLKAGELVGDRFHIVRFVGKGGMGEVYEARDGELGGTVALKILIPELCGDPDFLQRFRREVLLARQVTHANVCRVFDVGYDRGGEHPRVFLTMEFLEGETLSRRLRRVGRMPAQAAFPLIRQMAAGLGALHEQGIVHRDFKPGNVLLVSSGSGPERAVISDFGLARALDPASETTLTRSTHMIGTPEYMAPEQLLGGVVTPAADIYALGLVMYLMLTGKRAFPGGRVTEKPEPPREQSAEINPQWNEAILRCLARDPADRPATAADVMSALDGGRLPRIGGNRPSQWRSRWWAIAAALIILAGIPLGMRLQVWNGARQGQTDQTQNLALLPFKVLTEDPALRVFAEGLTETITSRMSQFEKEKTPFQVVPASEVRSQGARSAGEARQKFHVSAAVEGTLESQGDRLRLLLTVIDTRTMRQLETIPVEDDRGNSWRLQDTAVTRLAKALNLRLQPRYAKEQQETSPVAPGAYELYLQARGYLRRNDQPQSVASAVPLLNRAIELDPKFALAYSALGLARLYQFMDTRNAAMMDRALESGNEAVKLDPNVPDTNISLGLILSGTGRYQEALERFEKAIQLDSKSNEAHQGLAGAYYGLHDYTHAEATYLKAIALRPDDWTGYKALALYYYQREDYTKAAVQFQRVVELTPDNAQGYLNLGVAQYGRQDWSSAEKAWLRALELEPKSEGALANLGKVYLDERHQTAAAIDMYQRALALSKRDYRIWGQLGRAYARSGQSAKATESFGKAVELIDAELLINPKNVSLYSSLAFYRALMGRKDFVVAVERALQLAPERGETLERAAEAYAIAGNRERARELLAKAVARGVPMKSVLRSDYLKNLTATKPN